MPNNAYIRGRAREQKLVNKLRKEGWIAVRSAGSHSKFDVWAWNDVLKQFRVYQLKSKKGARNCTETTMWMHSDVTAKFIWVKYD
jgi:Holliday junction resolvase